MACRRKKEAFQNIRDQLNGFDMVHGHTWYGFYYSHLGHDLTRFPVIHTHTSTPRRAKGSVNNYPLFIANLDAFVTAARSVTFIMQSEFDKSLGFKEWYKLKQ